MVGEYQLEELNGGHSGAENYKITQPGQSFMLKIFPPNFSTGKITTIPTICALYDHLGIPSLYCLKTGRLSATQQDFCIYNYIDGANLDIIGDEEYTPTDNYRLGVRVGKWLKLLKAATLPPSVNFENANVPKLTHHINQTYEALLPDTQASALLSAYFDLGQLKSLLNQFNQASLLFSEQDMHLIYGDIKRSNLMRNQNGELHIIAIESLKYGHDMLNFRHQMTWLLRPDRVKRTQFLKGVFDGLYNNTRPAHFNQQILYIYTFNFIEHFDSVYRRGNLEESKEYLALVQKALPILLHPNQYII